MKEASATIVNIASIKSALLTTITHFILIKQTSHFIESISTSKTRVAPTQKQPRTSYTSRNHTASSSHAISHVGRNDQTSFLTMRLSRLNTKIPGAHSQKTLFPSTNHASCSKFQGERSSSVQGRIELLSILVKISLTNHNETGNVTV